MTGLLASTVRTSMMLALRVVTQATSLVLLAQLLGPESYANVAALASLALVMGILPGLGSGYVVLAGAHDPGHAAEAWRYAWPVAMGLGAVGTVIYCAAAPFITGSSAPLFVVACLGASELLCTPLVLLCSFILQSRDRVPLSQFAQWLPLALRLIGTALAFTVAAPNRLTAFAFLQIIACALGLAANITLVSRYVRLSWKPRMPSRAELATGSTYAAMQVVAANPAELDKVLAIHALGAGPAGVYAAGSRVLTAAVTPAVALLLSIQPRLFRQAAIGSRAPKYFHIAGLSAACGGVAMIGMVLLSPAVAWMLGPRFDDARMVIIWLAPVAPFLALRLGAGTVLLATGSAMQRLTYELVGTVALGVAIAVLAPRHGLPGMAVALLLAEAIMAATGWLMIRRAASSLDRLRR